MVGLLLALAHAGPTLCDPEEAATLLQDARIPEHRAPITHPDLLPGVALSRTTTTPALKAALRELCTDPDLVSVATADRWEGAGWSAHRILVTASTTRGCTLVQRAISVSVGIQGDQPPTYDLLGALPQDITPIGDCTASAAFVEETVIAGEGTPVQIVHVARHDPDQGVHTQVVARYAQPTGFSEQILLDPAPPRYAGGTDGPELAVAPVGDAFWIVAHHGRTIAPTGCIPDHDQTVWRHDGDRWDAASGRDALLLLADQGLWRLASTDGFLHIVAQDDEGDADTLVYRERRLGRRYPEPLHMLRSSDLPSLNPGFVVVAPAPFASQQAAEAARKTWRSLQRNYVKQAWVADPSCPE